MSIKKAIKTLNQLTNGTSKKQLYKTWSLYMTEDEKCGFYFDHVYNYMTKGKGGKK